MSKRIGTIAAIMVLTWLAIGFAKENIIVGKSRSLGKGKIWCWVAQDENKKATEIGINFSANSLSGLADTNCQFLLDLPVKAACEPYNHVMVNWNPNGHTAPIYSVPHFDFHFYLVTKPEHLGIPYSLDTVSVPVSFQPKDYFSTDSAMPAMGVHWVDSQAEELHGKPFTKTFIYGFYQGKMTFLEPMITTAYFETKPNSSSDIKLPGAFQRDGFYPKQYTVNYNPTKKEYSVTLKNLAFYKGTK